MVSMDLLAKVSCENCGRDLFVGAPNLIMVSSITVVDEGLCWSALAVCQNCEEPVSEGISEDFAKKLIDQGAVHISFDCGKIMSR